MLLLADGVGFVEPAADFGVEFRFRTDMQVVRVTSRIKCFDFVEAMVVDLARQNEVTGQMRFARRGPGKTHPYLEDDSRFFRDHARTVAAAHYFGELAEDLEHVRSAA